MNLLRFRMLDFLGSRVGTGEEDENDEDEDENENGKTTRWPCRRPAQSFVRDLHRIFW